MIGQTLAHYRIEEKLGAGGMGVVYRARDTRLGRSVAIKLLGEDAPLEPAARQRLIVEAQTASSLNHPHICTIYEVGEAEGQAYIAMELVEGRELSTLIPADGLPMDTVLRYGAQIADALAHAHERGVIHRDLKTANVVMTPDGRAKVLDFGVARRFESRELQAATESRLALAEAETAVAGTLHYLAPEVLRGEPADARSDLWALGVVLYEMAAGKLPFEGQTGFELSSTILREPPRPLPPRVPAGLRAIIQRCLVKEPGQRYQRASEVRAALEALGSDTAITPAAPVPGARRDRWLWIGSAVFLVFVLTLFALLGGRDRGRDREAAPGVSRLSTGGKPSANQEANEYFEKSILFLIAKHDLPRARQMLERTLELDPHFAEARALYGFSHLLMIDGGFSNDSGWLYKAEEELRRALKDDPTSARAHSALAAVYLFQGRKELVPVECQKALEIAPDQYDANVSLLNYHQLNGEYTEALALARKVVERNPVFWPARFNLGDILRQQGDTAGAIREQEKVLEQDPQNRYAIARLARAYIDLGQVAQVRQVLERGSPEERQNYQMRILWAQLYALEGNPILARKEMDSEVLRYAGLVPYVTVQVAEVYALLGDARTALDWLDRAVRNGDERAEWFERDPLLANVRDHPRFKQILESVAFRRQQRSTASPGSP